MRWNWLGDAALFTLFVLVPAGIIFLLATVQPMGTAQPKKSGPSDEIILRCNADAQRGYWPIYCR